jgi:hypothetical protein
MAKYVVIREERVPNDRSFIEYVYKNRLLFPAWVVQADDLKTSLKVWMLDTPFSLIISRPDPDGAKLIAAIPEGQPFTIEIYDGEKKTIDAISALINTFPSEKPVIVKIK